MRQDRSIAAKFLCALALSSSFLLTGSPAKADSLDDNMMGRWSTAKKVTTGALLGATALSMSFVVYSIVQQEDAKSRINEDFPRTTSGSADCKTAAECGELRNARRDLDAWQDRMTIGGVAFLALFAGTAASAMLWPSERTRITASASPFGGSLGLVGRF